MPDDDRIWQELGYLRADLRDLRIALGALSDRLRGIEIAHENSAIRNRSLPGWVIAGMGVLVSLSGVLVTLWLSGRVP